MPKAVTALVLAALIAPGFIASAAMAGPPLKFWNLTARTVTGLYFAPVGTTHWSGNICLTDPDRSVDPDERLRMPGVTAGTYDLRVVDQAGRSCVFHRIPVSAQGPYAFSISENQMKTCNSH